VKKIYSTLAAAIFISTTILGVNENTSASTIQWETFSEGVTTYDSVVKIKPDTTIPTLESENIYGAGFFTQESGFLNMEISVFMSDISLFEFENPRFVVATSSEDFFWNEKDSYMTIFDSWSFPLAETINYFTHINLAPQSYLSFFLQTRGNEYTYGLGRFNFFADITTPPNQPQ